MPLPANLVHAIRFLTVLRVPDSGETMAPDWLARAMKYFPLVGAGIGLLSALVLLLADRLWGPTIAALLAVAASIILTSALHEDGLADTADAFGGGWTVDKRLAIMKDSRIGTYGALALGLGVALRVAVLAALPPMAAAATLIALHAAARVMPALVMNNLAYAGDTAAMKVSYAETPVRSGELQFALAIAVLAALPLMWVSLTSVITGWICGALLAMLLAAWSKRLIGGYTGDVLGAVEQVCEIGFLLGVLAVVSF